MVEYFPGNAEDKQLPNGMKSAPAIVTQLFSSEGNHPNANLTVFVMDHKGTPVRSEWSVFNEAHPVFQSNPGCPHFVAQ